MKTMKNLPPIIAVPLALTGVVLGATRTSDAGNENLLNVLFNGKRIGSGIELHGAAYVPARTVAGALGATVIYNRETHTVKVDGGTYQKGYAAGYSSGSFVTYIKENPSPRSLDDCSMYNIKSLGISIEKLNPEEDKTPGFTLTRDQLKEDVELKLLQNDIHAAKSGEGDGFIGVAVTIDPVHDDHDTPHDLGFAYSIEISLNQSVKLDRDKSIFAVAATWTSGSAGVASKEGASEAIRKKVSEQIDKFIVEYQKENAKVTN